MHPDTILSRRTKALRSALNEVADKDPSKETMDRNNILTYSHIFFGDKILFTVRFKRKKRKQDITGLNGLYYWEFIDIQESTT